ncbi:MAG: ABC transporter permease [Myxococcales bacterium]|nr:ABC transporter permease [Myxococcales bacterium]
MRAWYWVLHKDLRRFFADRRGAVLTVLMPVVLASLFGMMFAPRPSSDALSLLVADEDGGPRVRAFVAAVLASPSFEVAEVDAATARRRLAAGDASLALVLPAGTESSLKPAAMFGGERGAVELLYDPSHRAERSMAVGLLTELLMRQMSARFADPAERASMFADLDGQVAGLPDTADRRRLRQFFADGRALGADGGQGSPADGADGDRAAAAGGGFGPPVDFVEKEVAAVGEVAGYNSYAHSFAGMLLMYLLFAGQSSARRLLVEREEGSLLRVRLAPVRPAAVLLGNAASAAVIALLATVAVYAVGMAVFGVRVHGSWVGFALVVVAQAIFVGGFALLLAGLGRSDQQIAAIGSLAVLLLSVLGGAMVPSFIMPPWVRAVGQALPTYWATRGLAAMTWRGLGLEAALLPAAIVASSGVLIGLVGLRRFRWE